MKRRIRIGAASLAVAAGLVGAVAAPASGDAPRYTGTETCLDANGNFHGVDFVNGSPVKTWREWVKDNGCVRNTLVIVDMTRVP